MNLAQLIYNALHQPQLRLALDNGTLDTAQLQLSQQELASVLDAFRYAPKLDGRTGSDLWEVLSTLVGGWGDNPE